MQLLDHFEHVGPNGVHFVLRFPLCCLMVKLWLFGRLHSTTDYVCEISRQILLGLDFVHGQGVDSWRYPWEGINDADVSTELQLANILFSIDCDLSRRGDSIQLMEPKFGLVKWLSGVGVDNKTVLRQGQKSTAVLLNDPFLSYWDEGAVDSLRDTRIVKILYWPRRSEAGNYGRNHGQLHVDTGEGG